MFFKDQNYKKFLIFIMVSVLASCATQQANMQVESIKTYDQFSNSFNLLVIGGSKSRVESNQYEAALRHALLKSRIIDNFEDSTFDLSVQILSIKEPIFGGAFTVSIRSLWLVKSDKCSSVLRKQIISEYTAEFMDSLIGVQRSNLAVEGSVRTNIKDGINFLATEGITWRDEKCLD